MGTHIGRLPFINSVEMMVQLFLINNLAKYNPTGSWSKFSTRHLTDCKDQNHSPPSSSALERHDSILLICQASCCLSRVLGRDNIASHSALHDALNDLETHGFVNAAFVDRFVSVSFVGVLAVVTMGAATCCSRWYGTWWRSDHSDRLIGKDGTMIGNCD